MFDTFPFRTKICHPLLIVRQVMGGPIVIFTIELFIQEPILGMSLWWNGRHSAFKKLCLHGVTVQVCLKTWHILNLNFFQFIYGLFGIFTCYFFFNIFNWTNVFLSFHRVSIKRFNRPI